VHGFRLYPGNCKVSQKTVCPGFAVCGKNRPVRARTRALPRPARQDRKPTPAPPAGVAELRELR
ncbi:MAG: hypothetical protein ACKOS8_18050, partial [Gemmataceae bacterium]